LDDMLSNKARTSSNKDSHHAIVIQAIQITSNHLPYLGITLILSKISANLGPI
jgi:hypothetical protein